MTTTTTNDKLINNYQSEGKAASLIKQYDNFLNKYLTLFQQNVINLKHYDIRCFLAFFISDKKTRINLRGKYHTKDTIKKAHSVQKYLQHKFRNHTKEELKNELIIPFLECAKRYENQGKGFEKFLYKAYKFKLQKHIQNFMKWDVMDYRDLIYKDISIDEDYFEEEMPDELVIEMDEAFELTDPKWIHGKYSEAPFDTFKPHERYILVKYYFEEYTDKQIARMLPYNPKSIHRIRKRLYNQLLTLYDKGDLKCLRLPMLPRKAS